MHQFSHQSGNFIGRNRNQTFCTQGNQGKRVGIIARVTLASGMLTGKLKRETVFAEDDHRRFNRYGEAFDRGETFSGIDYDTGLQAVNDLKAICPKEISMAQFALRWILMFDDVSCTIPGAKHPAQVEENVRSADLPPLDTDIMRRVEKIYNREIRRHVHDYW